MPHSAAQVLARMHERYATCDTYVDEGERISVIVGPHFPDGQETLSYRFRTAFVRPADLFFDFREFWRGTEDVRASGVICATAREVNQWWSLLPDRDTRTTLSMAMARFTGVTGGTASAVSSLLLGTTNGSFALPEAGSARILDEVELDGRPCFVVDGVRGGSRWPVRAWIDQDTLLLHRSSRLMVFEEQAHEVSVARLREYLDVKRSDKSRAALESRLENAAVRRSPAFASEMTTTWRARMDVPIERAVFEFQAPHA